jgi:hypothetical protein
MKSGDDFEVEDLKYNYAEKFCYGFRVLSLRIRHFGELRRYRWYGSNVNSGGFFRLGSLVSPEQNFA